MAPLYVRNKVCIVTIHVRNKFADFARHMDGSNTDFAPHMERSHADFAQHIERRLSFRDQKIAQIAISDNFLKELVKTTYIKGVYMIYVTTLENEKYFLGRVPFSDCTD